MHNNSDYYSQKPLVFFLPAAVHIFSAVKANKMRWLKEANQIYSPVRRGSEIYCEWGAVLHQGYEI